jgi:hypothetical protein
VTSCGVAEHAALLDHGLSEMVEFGAYAEQFAVNAIMEKEFPDTGGKTIAFTVQVPVHTAEGRDEQVKSDDEGDE